MLPSKVTSTFEALKPLPVMLPLKEIFPSLSSSINLPNLKLFVVTFPEYCEAACSEIACADLRYKVPKGSVVSVPNVTKSLKNL